MARFSGEEFDAKTILGFGSCWGFLATRLFRFLRLAASLALE
jgi:hypothetical protein